MGETTLAEIFLNMPFGDISDDDRHLSAYEILKLFLFLQNPTVKFLNIHLYIK